MYGVIYEGDIKMNEKQFIKKYCHNCGSQRCEGIGTDWFDGCQYKWNLDGQDPAAEIAKLQNRINNLVDEYLILKQENELLIKHLADQNLRLANLADTMPKIMEDYKTHLLNKYGRGNTNV